jgi:glutamate formiminotransferase/formiminotetrahydrofolate cyclodeaminase
MNHDAIIECVPNFSEGRDLQIIKEITDAIEAVDGVKLLDVDPGKATNRTVVTFVGAPSHVINAAFEGIKKASEIIDMAQHSGEHPRMGATDVCPLIPISGISLEETVQYAHQLAERVGQELDIPVYLYEAAATSPERANLATIRAGEYEGLANKVVSADWKPDYGPAKFNSSAGATVIGVRDFLIAYNVNLNTTSVRRANAIAFDVREKGRIKREGDPLTGKILRDEAGIPLRVSGTCKSVKAIGWFIEEYGIAQISMNLTNISDTNLHEAFEACRRSAADRGIRVTGSELVGLVPKQVMLEAGKYFLHQQKRSSGIAEEEIIRIAVKSLGLDELGVFDPKKKIIEYQLEDDGKRPLIHSTLKSFANETASESPAPGGGSIAAYVGSLGGALATMVANLSAHKRGWDDRWQYFSDWAERGQAIQSRLQDLVDADTHAFNAILDAIRLPKGSDEEKKTRLQAIEDATKHAVDVPLSVMQESFHVFEIAKEMAEKGNQNSISDAGVAALCARAAVHGAFLNVKINLMDIGDQKFAASRRAQAEDLLKHSDQKESDILAFINDVLDK